MVLGGLYLYLRKYVSKYPENKVVENIYVGSIDAGNMTSQELKTALEEYLEAKKATKVTLLVDDKNEAVTLGDFGIGYENIDELVKNAVAYGPNFLHRPDLCHQPDEHIYLSDFILWIAIYAKAIYSLAE